MATERLPMRKIREVLRLRWQLGRTVREVSRALDISVGVVAKIAARAKTAGLTWEDAEKLDETGLEEKLYGLPAAPSDARARPDPIYMHQELRRPGVTLELLHLEYLEQHPDGLRHTAFCDVYRRWHAKAGVVMRQVHKAGEKTFVDYSGKMQRTYGEMARHYSTAIVPARPRKPRDKAKVEVGVQIAQRWILARLRNEQFFSLRDLNARIAELREELNARPMKKLSGATRRDLYERYDRPAMKSLPATAYEITEWKQVRVNLDYHVEFDKHWYSAPYVLVREELWACATATTVQLFHRGQRVAVHARSRVPHKHTTDLAHMPEAHRMHSAGVDGVLAWATTFGPWTEAMARRLIEANPIKEQGWRSARGLRRVAEKYGAERTERACARALFFGARSYKPVANILALGREGLPLPSEEPVDAPAIDHENVRGPDYYQ